MNTNSPFWVRAALINLCIVATLGTIMRYKIGFEFPYFNQKFLQEAHSHFAFTGWITHTLYFLMVTLFRTNLSSINEKIYRILIFANLFCAYGMLVSFSFQGYGPISIFFSSLSILTGYVFSYFALRDAVRLPPEHPGKNWIKAAIWFGILSTIGTIILTHMMATRQYNQTTYLGSIFFYLHFQYNGLFLFACMALFMDRIKHFILNPKHVRYSFWLFFLSGIPAFFLSTLWADLPVWLYVFVVLAAVLQVIGWWFFIRLLWSNIEKLKLLFPKPALILFLVVALALTFKLLLQLGSTVPAISILAFGFRPIVIAYLHLVLLLIVSVFLLTFMYGTSLLNQNRNSRVPLKVFVAGVILNETVLTIQGIAGFSYTVIPYVNEMLFAIAFVLWGSSFFLLLAQFRASNK